MEIGLMEIGFVIIGGIALFLDIQHRGKLGAKYLGYYWEIILVKKGRGRKLKKIEIQAVDARQHLIRWCEYQEPIMLTLIEALEGNPLSWSMTKLYIKAAKHYEPEGTTQAPKIMYYYAKLLMTLDYDEEWEIKSIEQSGWNEVRPDQVDLMF